MIFHVLNGDGLAGNFDLEGEKVICRECLIEGEHTTESLAKFWNTRAKFIETDYQSGNYKEFVKGEFDKLNKLQSVDEVNLWFGNEAFCQVNLWFIFTLLKENVTEIYRVFPDANSWNCSFDDLENCYRSRRKLTNEDLKLGKQLWKAFCYKDSEELRHLAETKSKNFPQLKRVCEALIEKDYGPKEILNEIQSTGETEFNKIFLQFKEKGGVYGYGDLQVKKILERI